jgi:hypothetical protein
MSSFLLSQYKAQKRYPVLKVVNPRVPQNAANFLIDRIISGSLDRLSCMELVVGNLVTLHFFFNLHSGGWNQGPLDTAAT